MPLQSCGFETAPPPRLFLDRPSSATLTLCRGVLRGFGRVEFRHEKPQKRQDKQTEHAPFRADAAAGEPTGRIPHGRIQQASVNAIAAVRNGIEESLSKIPGELKADWPPQVASAAKGEAKDKAEDKNSQDTAPGLPGIIEEMPS